MSKDLQVIIDEQQVAKENAQALIKAFGAPFTEAGKILTSYKTIEVTDESQVDLMAEAREKRLTLKKIRTGVENKRKELKEDALRTGKAIDGVARYIKETIQPAEEYLELQEKFAEIRAAERAAKLKAERTEKLLAYTDDVSFYNLDVMDESAFETLLADLKTAHEQRVAKEEAERKAAEEAEKARIAEEKRIREENERLRKEAEAREKEREAERAAEAKKLEEERHKREKLEAEQRAKDEALAKEKAEKEAAEARAKAEAEEAERQALLAPDKEKLLAFSVAIGTIRDTKLPAVKTKQAQDVINLIEEMLTKMQGIIQEKAKGL